MFGRQPIDRYSGGNYELNPNKLLDEVRRLGKWRANAPLKVESNSSGFVVSLAGDLGGNVLFGFASLTQQVNPNGKGTAQPYIVNNPPDGNWQLDTNTNDAITVYAPPTLNSNEYYASGTTVTVAYNSTFQRWVILSSPYCSC